MGKVGYNLKNMFKSKEQIKMEAQMEFRKNKRSFEKYYSELDTSIKTFSKMAQKARMDGNEANALACAKFILKLQRTQTKVQGLLQRFEMMQKMAELSGVMSDFVKACAKMGFSMDANINLKSMWKNTAAMDQALGKLDAMTDQMDMVFDTIDAGLGQVDGEVMDDEESDAEAAELLDKIMGRHNTTTYAPERVAPAAEAVSEGAGRGATEQDDTDERLRRMMEELKD